MIALKMAVFILSLGLDTLMMAISLGVARRPRRARVAVVFALFEAGMPVIGLFVGRGAGALVGRYASPVGGVALIVLACWLIFFEREEADGAPDKRANRGWALKGWALVATGLSVSLDELAAGFSLGLVGIPVVLTLALIATQSFAFTWLGMTCGARLRPFFGEWAEKAAGAALGLLGLWILVESIMAVA